MRIIRRSVHVLVVATLALGAGRALAEKPLPVTVTNTPLPVQVTNPSTSTTVSGSVTVNNTTPVPVTGVVKMGKRHSVVVACTIPTDRLYCETDLSIEAGKVFVVESGMGDVHTVVGYVPLLTISFFPDSVQYRYLVPELSRVVHGDWVAFSFSTGLMNISNRITMRANLEGTTLSPATVTAELYLHGYIVDE
jgi:hypothetical protein